MLGTGCEIVFGGVEGTEFDILAEFWTSDFLVVGLVAKTTLGTIFVAA